MKHITLADNEGGKISGYIPEGWHEVPLSSYLEYIERLQGKPAGLEVFTVVAAVAALPVGVLQNDVSIAALILPYMPWVAQLPTGEAQPTFQHEGKTYEHVGNLEKVNAGQFEALLSYLQEAEGKPAQAAPYLLAVLYKEQGAVQDAYSVAAAAEAFLSLPMSIAWPAVAFFLTTSEPYARRILTYSQSRDEALKAVSQIEKLLKSTPSRTLSSRIAARLVKAYTTSARTLLARS